MQFRNPTNGYVEEVRHPFLWCLLFGTIYFAVKGVWTHAAASLCLAVLSVGISWLIYPFFAKRIIERHYLRLGWIPASSNVAHA